MSILQLPTLTSKPIHHPDSCLSLSQPLLDLITSTLPKDSSKLLSIGSGSGLLEALLSSSLSAQSIQATVYGVEPHPGAANKYLSKENLHLVPGTWATLGQALEYNVWLFVYPRDRKLVEKYIDVLATTVGRADGKKMTVVWAGPRVDWKEEFGRCFDREGFVRDGVYEGSSGGVAEWEVVVVLRWEGVEKSAE